MEGDPFNRATGGAVGAESCRCPADPGGARALRQRATVFGFEIDDNSGRVMTSNPDSAVLTVEVRENSDVWPLSQLFVVSAADPLVVLPAVVVANTVRTIRRTTRCLCPHR